MKIFLNDLLKMLKRGVVSMAIHIPRREQHEVVNQTQNTINMTSVTNVMNVANFFLHKSQSDFRPNTKITHLKLQKLVYYAQAWHLAMLNQRLFDSRLEAWVHGPVSPELYNEYRQSGYQVITNSVANPFNFNERTLGVLNAVWQIYGDKDAKELEKLTHSELPWLDARRNIPLHVSSNNEISLQDMNEYYSRYLNKG